MDPALLTLILSSTTSKSPIFVDVGANHPVRGSQTRELEEFGWKGLCIEPNRRLHALYVKVNRTCELDARVVFGDSASVQPFAKTDHTETNGLALEGGDNAFAVGRMTHTAPLVDVVTEYLAPADPLTEINFLSMDTEGSEELVLTPRTLSSLNIRTLLVERPSLRLTRRLFNAGFFFVAHDTREFATLFTKHRPISQNGSFSLLPAKCISPSSRRSLGRSRLPGLCPSVFGCCLFSPADDPLIYRKFQ
jgi:hypothetical protein